MKLEDVKDQIDNYFANADPAKVIKEWEEMGCVFEPIKERPQNKHAQIIKDVKEGLENADPEEMIQEFENLGHEFTPVRTPEEWDKLAEVIKNELGESIVEEELGEENPYNWWLEDMTVQDLIDFLKYHNF